MLFIIVGRDTSGNRGRLALQENGRRLALVIGVDEAKNARLPILKYATNDAEGMAKILHDSCGFEVVETFVGERATSTNVKRTVLALARQRNDDDFLLLYFSGHGQPMTIGGDQPDVFLVTHDFNEEEVLDDENLHFSMRWLQNKLYIPTRAGKVLLILDCCYAGNIGQAASNPYLDDLKARISKFFGQPLSDDQAYKGGLRLALTATGHDQSTGEQDGSGIMTKYLQEALQGRVDEVLELENQGKVSLQRIQRYLEQVMPNTQNPSVAGDYAGRECILAQYPERAKELRMKRVPVVRERPLSYTPLLHDPLFQERPYEFEHIEQLLFGSPDSGTPKTTSARVGLVGITGMGGIGKSQLAAETAHRYGDRYPDGVFWTPMIGSVANEWQRQLAELASATDYFPASDDASSPENQKRRARHLCRYLAEHADALLILDNVEEADLVLRYLVALAGTEIRCSIIYTSRNTIVPTGVQRYIVEQLPEEAALCLLLGHRPALIEETLKESQSDEVKAARAICHYVDYLPLALTLLREHLQDENTMPTHLHEYLRQYGALNVRDAIHDEDEAPLYHAFLLSWEKIHSEAARCLFKLATYFPEATAIPLWLLGLAAGLEGENTSLDLLGRARRELQKWSMIEVLPDNQIRLHPLICEFGRHRVERDEQGTMMLREAGERLVATFTDINTLEQSALKDGYWRCLEQVQGVLQYAQILQPANIEHLENIERSLARDSSLMGADNLWPEKIPGLFYQQLYNQLVEEGYPLPATKFSTRWIKQNKPVGAENGTLLRELKHPDIITCVVYSPDGKMIATGCEDSVARIWEASSGQCLTSLKGHTEAISCLSFSPDGTTIVTGSHDSTARVWNYKDEKTLHILRGHTRRILSVDFSPNGKRIVTTSADGTFRVWNVATGEEEVNLFHGHILPIYAVFSMDGKHVVTCGECTAFIWDIERAAILREIEEPLYEEQISIWAVKVTRTHTNTVFISSTRRSWSIDNAEVVTRVRDVDSEKLLTEIVEPNSDAISLHSSSSLGDAAMTRDGRRIVLCSDEKLVRVWDVMRRTAIATLQGHTGRVTSAAFSPDTNTLATGSEDRMARLWNVTNGTMIAPLRPSEGRIRTLDLSYDGSKLIVGTGFGKIQIWDVAIEEKISDVLDTLYWINSVTFSKNDKYAVSSAVGTIQLIDINLNCVALTIDVTNLSAPMSSGPVEIYSACLSPDNSVIVSSSPNKIQLWSTQDGKLIHELDEHDGRAFHIVFSVDGKRLITASTDGIAHIWDMSNYKQVAVLKGAVGNVTSLSISHDGTKGTLGTVDGTVQIWSLEHKKVLFTLKRRNVQTICTTFSPNGHVLVANDLYGYTSLWSIDDRNGGQLLGTYKTFTEVNVIRWQDDKHLLMAGKSSSGYRPVFYHLSLEGDWS